jgi:hypothetical protein
MPSSLGAGLVRAEPLLAGDALGYAGIPGSSPETAFPWQKEISVSWRDRDAGAVVKQIRLDTQFSNCMSEASTAHPR